MLMRLSLPALAAIVIGAAGCGRFSATPPELQPTVIVNARLVDGTGAAARRAAVRIVGSRIMAVGDLQPLLGDRIIDAAGLVLAPGFIDTHSHHDRGLHDRREALAVVSQGVTTIIAGQDGGSAHPLAEFLGRLDREPAAINVASFAGHNTLRARVLGADYRRAATAAEIDAMAALLAADLDAGALGLSTGLEYDPGLFAGTDEVVALARVAAAAGGRYATHLRSEDRHLWAAVDEAIRVGRDAGLPVHISHLKLAMRSLWGQADSLLRVLDAARAEGVAVTADVYPYPFWQSTLTVLFPDRNFEDRQEAEFVLRELAPADGLRLGRFDPEPGYVGRTLAEIAGLRGQDAATTLLDLIREAAALTARTGRSAESVIGTSMDEGDVRRLTTWPYANIASDGELAGRHPRGFGTFPRVLGRYVRAEGVLPLEEAIRKMTSLPAASMGLTGRGVIRPGSYADLVLLDPATIIDHATPEEPNLPASGVRTVWVNGQIVYADGRTTGRRPGRVLRRGGALPR
jgi:N-acyl-D-amino-acid deacylase